MQRRDFIQLAFNIAAYISLLPDAGSFVRSVVSHRECIEYNNVPEGWLIPDGSTFDTEIYPELFTVLNKNVLPDLSGQLNHAHDDRINIVKAQKGTFLIRHIILAKPLFNMPAGYIVEACFTITG